MIEFIVIVILALVIGYAFYSTIKNKTITSGCAGCRGDCSTCSCKKLLSKELITKI
ncbi:MAG: FeoB-associated Cys-rich membrane protein [Ruminococcaceae bacterium]|nr:FeoB-associated Cys-rich membrane protein [Oscillospiraceae bacterium]